MVQIGDSETVQQECPKPYEELTAHGIEVFWDDRQARPGEKFADADLMGIPKRVVISEKTISSNKYELKKRQEEESKLVDKKELFEILELQ